MTTIQELDVNTGKPIGPVTQPNNQSLAVNTASLVVPSENKAPTPRSSIISTTILNSKLPSATDFDNELGVVYHRAKLIVRQTPKFKSHRSAEEIAKPTIEGLEERRRRLNSSLAILQKRKIAVGQAVIRAFRAYELSRFYLHDLMKYAEIFDGRDRCAKEVAHMKKMARLHELKCEQRLQHKRVKCLMASVEKDEKKKPLEKYYSDDEAIETAVFIFYFIYLFAIYLLFFK